MGLGYYHHQCTWLGSELTSKKKKKKKKMKKIIKSSGGGGGGGGGEKCPHAPPPPTVALHLITLISHKPWVPYYQTLSSINIHLYGNIPKLTLDLWPTSRRTSQIWPSVYYQDSYQTIPQLDTPTWSCNFMYYGIVLVHVRVRMHTVTVRYVHTCTLYINLLKKVWKSEFDQ